MTCIHFQRVCFDLKVYSKEAVLKHEHYLAHLFWNPPFCASTVSWCRRCRIHRYVAAPQKLAHWFATECDRLGLYELLKRNTHYPSFNPAQIKLNTLGVAEQGLQINSEQMDSVLKPTNRVLTMTEFKDNNVGGGNVWRGRYKRYILIMTWSRWGGWSLRYTFYLPQGW